MCLLQGAFLGARLGPLDEALEEAEAATEPPPPDADLDPKARRRELTGGLSVERMKERALQYPSETQ